MPNSTRSQPPRNWRPPKTSRQRSSQRVVRSTARGHLRRVGAVRRALVEGHDDVRTQVQLDLHAELGAEEMRAAVEMGAEFNAVVGDPVQVAQRKHLETRRCRSAMRRPSPESGAARPSGRPARGRAADTGGRCCPG